MKKILSLFLLPFWLHAFIIESHSISDIKDHLEEGTLVIFDIDNTLMKTNQMLGSDQWFFARIGQLKEQGYKGDEALEKALAEWEAVQHLSRVRLVEEGSDKILKEVQQKGYTVIALTTRGLALSTRTVQQLQNLGISFKESAPVQEEHFLLNPRAVIFQDGILFTAGTAKGPALFKLLDQLHLSYKHILFINDKATHLRDVEITCEERGVPFTGLRFAYMDDEVKGFNPALAEVQRKHFGSILSDQEALKRIN